MRKQLVILRATVNYSERNRLTYRDSKEQKLNFQSLQDGNEREKHDARDRFV